MAMQFEDAALAERIIDEHVKLVRWIKGFGCTHLKINTGQRRPEGTTDADLKQMAKTMNELGKRISDEGLKFGVHAHLWTQLQDRKEIDRLMELTIQTMFTWCSTRATSIWQGSIPLNSLRSTPAGLLSSI